MGKEFKMGQFSREFRRPIGVGFGPPKNTFQDKKRVFRGLRGSRENFAFLKSFSKRGFVKCQVPVVGRRSRVMWGKNSKWVNFPAISADLLG